MSGLIDESTEKHDYPAALLSGALKAELKRGVIAGQARSVQVLMDLQVPEGDGLLMETGQPAKYNLIVKSYDQESGERFYYFNVDHNGDALALVEVGSWESRAIR